MGVDRIVAYLHTMNGDVHRPRTDANASVREIARDRRNDRDAGELRARAVWVWSPVLQQ